MNLNRAQEILDRAVADSDVPFVVAIVADRGGACWTGAAGSARGNLNAAPDTVFRVFSMTKAVGVAAAMILVDRELIAMDDAVDKHLPAAGEFQILDGWQNGEPVLRAPAAPPTLRHLATHTSGLAYDTWDQRMFEWTDHTGHPRVTTGQKAGLHVPLMFDPGTAWSYGIGIDWLGRVVEAVDGRPIDQFLADEIFGPLGMIDTACEVSAAMQPRLANVWKRAPDGGLVETDRAPPSNPEFYGMGHALYSTPQDYMSFLRMLLGQGALGDVRVLSESSALAMFDNAIGALNVPAAISANPNVSADVDLFPGRTMTHGLAGPRVEQNPGRRRAGSCGWAGVLNSHWWLDPSSGLTAVLMTQTLPFVEPRFMAAYDAFERSVYAQA